jgi:hypothetical protein
MIVGSQWSDGTTTRVVAQVIDVDTVKLVPILTGTDAEWVLNNVAISGGTLTHVAGNPTTGDRTVAASAVSQIWPFVHSRTVEVLVDDQNITEAGIYAGDVLRFRQRYVLPNAKKAVEYIIANVGNVGNSITASAIDGQIEFGITHEVDWTGNVRMVKSAYDEIGYDIVQDNTTQPKKLGINSGQTLTAYVHRSVAWDGNDFEAGVSVTAAPASEFEFTPARWADANDPPTAAVYVTTLSGNPNIGMFITIDDTVGQGVPAVRKDQGTALRISTSVKTYMYAGGANTPVGAGTLHESASVNGFFNAAAAPGLTGRLSRTPGWPRK